VKVFRAGDDPVNESDPSGDASSCTTNVNQCTAPNSISGPVQFAVALLNLLGASNRFYNQLSIFTWEQAEKGNWVPGPGQGSHNPLNTGLLFDGSYKFNCCAMYYKNWRDGLIATALTIENYPSIDQDLLLGARPEITISRIAANAQQYGTNDNIEGIYIGSWYGYPGGNGYVWAFPPPVATGEAEPPEGYSSYPGSSKYWPGYGTTTTTASSSGGSCKPPVVLT
jgi:hypothetical protein